MNEIIVNSDCKGDKTILVSKDEREMHVDVNTLRTKAKQILYANASANNLSVRKRVLAGQNEEIDVEKRLTELRKKAAELRERLLLLKNRFTPPPSPPPATPPSPPPSPTFTYVNVRTCAFESQHVPVTPMSLCAGVYSTPAG